METVKIEFGGDIETLMELEKFAKENGLETHLDELIQNSKTSQKAFVLALVGGIATISGHVAEFQKQSKKHLQIVTPSGTIITENYTAEELTKIFPSYKSNIFIKQTPESKSN